MSLLNQIGCPADLRKLSVEQLVPLARELRERIFNAVSRNGGHLASNLGVVELILALHYVYDFGPFPAGPDRLLFDVGHQCYAHKMLTGRAGQFDKLRKRGSISGFPNPEESPYDLFAVGHAGTAISTAVGMARGDAAMQRKNHVVAVVGDASIANGLSFEGLNGAGTLKRQLLIILNDNGMSISKPQGAFGQYLDRVRVSSTFEEAKKLAERLLARLPDTLNRTAHEVWRHFAEGVKSAIWPGQVFEALGMMYMGPVDGHDIAGLVTILSEIKHVDRPMLLHVKTVKGHGYEVASSEPTKMHSPSSFKLNGCRVELHKGDGKPWTTAFADAAIDLARHQPRLFALTAAMPDGTGLSKFEKEFPDRFIDTGICESHLMAMAAGMAKAGLRPLAAIYSTFTQRAFDQVWQECILNNLPVVLAMDRAGYVGDDGAVHHGFMDQAFLRPLPGIVLMAPSDEPELQRALKLAVSLENSSAIRYPRDVVPTHPLDEAASDDLRTEAAAPWQVGISRTLRDGAHATIISYGALTEDALAAACELADEGLDIGVVDARFCKPLDTAMLARTLREGHPVLTVEDHALQNGFGTAVVEHAAAAGLPTQWITRLGHPDRLIPHATRAQQLAEAGLDAPGIARAVRDAVRAAAQAPSHSVQV